MIGGFLGAGKTSLLNRLLRDAGGQRLGLIINDFGDINIDEQLIVSRDEEMLALANGCICCSIGSDFIRALIQLVTMEAPPDQIIIEASGVANPARIAAIARADKALRLQGVFVLVDVLNFTQQYRDPLLADTLEGQVAAADLLILTKIDEAEAGQVAEVEALLQQIRPDVRMVRVSIDKLPLDLLLDLSPGDALDASHGVHEHAHPFWSGSVGLQKPVARRALEGFVAGLPTTLLRLKGVVHLENGLHTVQYVAGRLELTPYGGASVSPSLVFIGVGEDRSAEIGRVLAAL